MQKRIYNFEKIRGVDVTSSPINVASNRASYMVNMINEGGTNKKRHGWRDIAWFEHESKRLPINGIYDAQTVCDGYFDLIVHAGTHFYRCFGDFSYVEEIKLSAGTSVKSTKSKGFVQGKKMWIVTEAGEYLVYDGEVIQPVESSMYAYIPTTSIGVTCHTEGNLRKKYQGVNLFHKRRKNRLLGATSESADSYIMAQYKLDGLIDFNFPVRLTLETAVEEFTITKNAGEGEEVTEEISGIICVTIDYADGVKNYSLTLNGEEKSGYYELDIHHFEVSNRDGFGHVLFGHMLATPLVEGKDNITVEFTADYERSINISASAEVSLAAGVGVLSLACNNVVYFSDFYHGYGYFSDIDYVGLGSEDKPVTAIAALDSGVGGYKEEEAYRISIDVSFNDEEMLTKLSPAIVSVHKGPGCGNQFCAVKVNGDSIVYNGLGVYGAINSQDKAVTLRSTNVNKELKSYDPCDAYAVSHDGRYYLFVGGRAFIADTRFKTYESNRLDAGYEYEWWIWDGCSCRCACSAYRELYIGTDNGTVRVLGDGYCDEERIHVMESELNYDGYALTLSDELGVQDGEELLLSNAYEIINPGGCIISTCYDSELKKSYIEKEDGYKYLKLELDDEDMTRANELYLGKDLLIIRYDGKKTACEYQGLSYMPNTVIVRIHSTTEVLFGTSCLAVDVTNRRYTVRLLEDGSFELLTEGGNVACLDEYDSLSITLLRRRPVRCEMRTGVIDFYKLHSKTLYKMAITPSDDTRGEIQIGYETNLCKGDKRRYVGDGFDFADFDFKSFVFDGNFAKSFVKRIFERNFNYIRFRFASESDGPFGIENAQAVYSVNNELRSDR